MIEYWSYLLAAVGILGLWLVGKKLKSGFIVGIVAQLLWVAYGLLTQQYGFLITAVAYSAINFINLRKWSKPSLDDAELARNEGYIAGLKDAAQVTNVHGGPTSILLQAVIAEQDKLQAKRDALKE